MRYAIIVSFISDNILYSGELAVVRDKDTFEPIVYPKESMPAHSDNLLQVVYDGEKQFIAEWEQFDVIRERVNTEWHKLAPVARGVLSRELKEKISRVQEAQAKLSAEMKASVSQ